MSDPQKPLARVTRQINAAPQRVFDAWLDPAYLGRWMFGPALRDEDVLRLAVDARVGGAFSFVVRRQTLEIDDVGHYLEIDRPRRLAFTWGIAGKTVDQSRVIVELSPQGTGTELVLTHELHPDWAAYTRQTEAGWTKMIDMLATVLG